HTALLKVEWVEITTADNGRVIKAGGTITVRWERVTWPSRTTGHTYDVSEKATIRAYLARQCGGEGFYVIDNPAGIEKLDRQGNRAAAVPTDRVARSSKRFSR